MEVLLYNRHSDLCQLRSIYRELRCYLGETADLYPKFDSWYNKIFYDLCFGNRSILVVKLKDQVAGYSIVKHSVFENKICSFNVLKKYRRNRIGTTLMEKSVELLQGNALITINERLVDSFSSIIEKYEFLLCFRLLNIYRANQYEYFFFRENVHSIIHNKSIMCAPTILLPDMYSNRCLRLNKTPGFNIPFAPGLLYVNNSFIKTDKLIVNNRQRSFAPSDFPFCE